jgi:hypothetical protein
MNKIKNKIKEVNELKRKERYLCGCGMCQEFAVKEIVYTSSNPILVCQKHESILTNANVLSLRGF